jgi:hypothetical protein
MSRAFAFPAVLRFRMLQYVERNAPHLARERPKMPGKALASAFAAANSKLAHLGGTRQ